MLSFNGYIILVLALLFQVSLGEELNKSGKPATKKLDWFIEAAAAGILVVVAIMLASIIWCDYARVVTAEIPDYHLVDDADVELGIDWHEMLEKQLQEKVNSSEIKTTGTTAESLKYLSSTVSIRNPSLLSKCSLIQK